MLKILSWGLWQVHVQRWLVAGLKLARRIPRLPLRQLANSEHAFHLENHRANPHSFQRFR
jgi:hypothetical protein